MKLRTQAQYTVHGTNNELLYNRPRLLQSFGYVCKKKKMSSRQAFPRIHEKIWGGGGGGGPHPSW